MRSILLFLSAAAMLFGQQRPPITGVSHIAIFTKDIVQSRAYYKDFLGLGEPFSLNNPDGSLSLTFFKVNERQYIEVFPEKTPNSDRLNHISVETSDIEGMHRYLAARGVKVPEKISTGRIKNRSFNVKDPEGHTVEFVQYMPEGWTTREKGKHLATGPSAKMTHIGILVGDLAKQIDFYGRILGFTETWRGSRDGQTLSWVNMKLPESDDYLEFMLYDQLPEPTKRGTAHHICLVVPDIEKAKASLEASTARKAYGRTLEVRTGINRKRQMNLYDPDGTRTELMEPGTVDGKPVPSSTAKPPR